MLLSWLNTAEATELGRSLADHFVPQTAAKSRVPEKKVKHSNQTAIDAFLRQVDRQARPLKLNLFKRAKLANSFKWRLLENGVEQGRIDELTQMLLLRLSAKGAALAHSNPLAEPPPRRPDPRRVDELLAQANRFGNQGSYTEAAECFQELLALDPRHAFARNSLGATLCNLGRYREAEAEFRRAIEIKRNFPDALCNLGTVLRWRGLMAEAETPLRRAVKLSPQHVNAQLSLGATLFLLGRLPDAKACFERALRVAPRSVDGLIGLAEIAAAQGHFGEAESLLKRALSVDPKAPGAWAAQAKFRKMTRADASWLEGAERLAGSGIAPVDEALIRFAIGKYWDDVGEFARAFRSYQDANELHKLAAEPYDRQGRQSFVDDVTRLYTRDALSRAALGASDSERPVFVIGMMRSGTSLVEQIISSHPDAKGAGELGFWNDVVRRHEGALRHELPDESSREKWGERYLDALTRYSPDALRIVDKSTFNSDHLGVIRCVFPRARILYLRRDPIDTCLSCYFQQFAPSLNFTMDLSDLAHYYREHRRLINHWRAVLPPDGFLDVPYAELVADQERWSRKIIEFLGLTWNASCLNFQETQRPVLTASSWQVRQKMYRGSVGRWRNYEKFIGPLLELAGAEDS